jgi:hypothetical protein
MVEHLTLLRFLKNTTGVPEHAINRALGWVCIFQNDWQRGWQANFQCVAVRRPKHVSNFGFPWLQSLQWLPDMDVRLDARLRWSMQHLVQFEIHAKLIARVA